MTARSLCVVVLACLLAGAGCSAIHRSTDAVSGYFDPAGHNGDDAALHAVADMEDSPTVSPDPAGESATGSGDVYDDSADLPETATAQGAMDDALDLCKASQEFWQKGELDNAIQALDQAYAIILKADTDGDAKLQQQKDDIRFLVSKRILEIYASRTTVVNGVHNAIPVVVNSEVQKEIDRFTKGADRDFFIASYKRSGRYRPFILKKLKEAGLPQELSWLPLIESGFKTKAMSSARALGLWQFIPSTGYKFGLERNSYIDQRLDPERSTDAAIQYLTVLHKTFGDWATALAAYNCGEGTVLRVIRQQRINYLDNFWDLYHRLPMETARYVPRFLATLYIVSHPEKYGLDSIETEPPLKFETVAVSRQVHLRDIAKAIGVPYNSLAELNPELRYSVLPPEQYNLRVPPGTGSMVLAGIDSMPIYRLPQTMFAYHRVRPGEALSLIARRYHTTVRRIMRANNLRSRNYIVAGKILKIPLSGKWVAAKTHKFEKARIIPATHTVRRGESLWILASRYGTTVKAIQKLNGLSGTSLRVGQVLRIPGGGTDSGPDAAKTAKTYTVKPGDSPFTIARSHNMSLLKFLRLNNLDSNTTIYPGQQMFVE